MIKKMWNDWLGETADVLTEWQNPEYLPGTQRPCHPLARLGWNHGTSHSLFTLCTPFTVSYVVLSPAQHSLFTLFTPFTVSYVTLSPAQHSLFTRFTPFTVSYVTLSPAQHSLFTLFTPFTVWYIALFPAQQRLPLYTLNCVYNVMRHCFPSPTLPLYTLTPVTV